MQWVGFICICVLMTGPLGHPVDNTAGTSTAVVSTSASEMEETSTITPKQHIRESQSLSDGEQEYVDMRKQVVLESLNSLGINCTAESVPHIALLGSGGGQRAAVSLVGSLYQMEQDGLLDTMLYLGGVSGSTWSMSSLYSDPGWSANMDRAVSRLSGPEVGLEEALLWLTERAEEDDFSLTDIWGLITSAGVMNQLDLRYLSEESSRNGTDPYPVYSAVEKNCNQYGPIKGKWFEVTPHESGFTELGLFVNTSRLGIKFQEGEMDKGLQMDMVRLQGLMGSAVADEESVINHMPDWLKGVVGPALTDEKNLMDLIFLWTEVPSEVESVWDMLDFYIRVYHTLFEMVTLLKDNTDDPIALSELDTLQKTLQENFDLNPFVPFDKKSPEERKEIFEHWGQEMLKPIETWSQSLEEEPHQQFVSWVITNIFPLIGRWEWGTTENFLYKYPNSAVTYCLRSKEQIHLIDAGVMLNMPYPPFLGDKRDVDLIIALEYSAGNSFETLTQARDYAANVKKPFPEIDDKVLEEKDWPKDCYVFQGEQNQPTIIYMPLFNRQNCQDPEELKAKMEEYSTFQLPFSQEKTEFLLETAKTNMKNNRDIILGEINKAVLHRQNKRI